MAWPGKEVTSTEPESPALVGLPPPHTLSSIAHTLGPQGQPKALEASGCVGRRLGFPRVPLPPPTPHPRLGFRRESRPC